MCVCVCVGCLYSTQYLHVGKGGLRSQSDSLSLILLCCSFGCSLAPWCSLICHRTVWGAGLSVRQQAVWTAGTRQINEVEWTQRTAVTVRDTDVQVETYCRWEFLVPCRSSTAWRFPDDVLHEASICFSSLPLAEWDGLLGMPTSTNVSEPEDPNGHGQCVNHRNSHDVYEISRPDWFNQPVSAVNDKN